MIIGAAACGIAFTAGLAGRKYVDSAFGHLAKLKRGRVTVADRLAEFGSDATARLTAAFQARQAAYPPKSITLVAIKSQRILDLYAADPGGKPRWITRYPILAASGGPGPKLRDGDRQVPEGFYRIESLNPNSAYHASLRLDYPNTFDRAKAAEEGRTALGGDIMIHGKAMSIGCLAMGDPAIEELFTLVATIGKDAVAVLVAPEDWRLAPPPTGADRVWLQELYRELGAAMAALPPPGTAG